MGRKKQNPRYNVLSCRCSDAQLDSVIQALAGRSVNQYLIEALTEKLISDRQRQIDDLFRSEP